MRRRSSDSAGATYLDPEATRKALRSTAREAARRDGRILRVILFGSLACGVPTPASDADLLVVLLKAEPRRMDRIPGLLRVFEGAPVPLDLHPLTKEEWDEAIRRGDPFLRRVEAEGLDLLVS